MGKGVDNIRQGSTSRRIRHLPIWWSLVSYPCLNVDSQKLTNRMSDPGTTYRSRDEVQQVRSERDAIAGLKKYILEWGATDEASLKVSPLFSVHDQY